MNEREYDAGRGRERDVRALLPLMAADRVRDDDPFAPATAGEDPR
jgi:hypothetical protein